MDVRAAPNGTSIPRNTVHSGWGMVTWNLLDILPGFLDNRYSKVSALIPFPPPTPNRDFHLDLDKLYA